MGVEPLDTRTASGPARGRGRDELPRDPRAIYGPETRARAALCDTPGAALCATTNVTRYDRCSVNPPASGQGGLEGGTGEHDAYSRNRNAARGARTPVRVA